MLGSITWDILKPSRWGGFELWRLIEGTEKSLQSVTIVSIEVLIRRSV